MDAGLEKPCINPLTPPSGTASPILAPMALSGTVTILNTMPNTFADNSMPDHK
ncbi:hypothetical protein D3C76_1624080 [compost metagenome]